MDRCFEAGLPNAWKTVMLEIFIHYDPKKKGKTVLYLKEIGPLFFILILGHSFASLVLLFEIILRKFREKNSKNQVLIYLP